MITVRGRGIAASCCVHLLSIPGPRMRAPDVREENQCVTERLLQRRSGAGAQLEAAHHGGAVPALLLGDGALALLRDVFNLPTLFADRPRVARRLVSWRGGKPVSLPHGATVVSGTDLEAALGVAVQQKGEAGEADFTIYAAAPFPAGHMRHFGARSAQAVPVVYRFDEDETSCWMEAVENGWLFCIPTGAGQGWLIAVGTGYERLLGQSRHLAPRLAILSEESAHSFDAQPRLLDTLQGTDWLACGTAALAFDPICGDGTAHAIREAILASATVKAMQNGEPAAALRLHYESMLIAAMRRHLKLCGDFYLSGGESPWWRAQYAALVDGHDWCSRRLAAMPPPRFALRGFDLVPLEVAA